MMNFAGTVTILNALIQTTKNGAMGFSDAASQATDRTLKELFHGRSVEYALATRQLQGLVRILGGAPKDSGTLTGAALRRWGKVRALFGDVDGLLLATTASAEDTAKAAFAAALANDLSVTVRRLLEQQRDDITRNQTLIRGLREECKANSARPKASPHMNAGASSLPNADAT